MNDKAVYRKATATLGLLIICSKALASSSDHILLLQWCHLKKISKKISLQITYKLDRVGPVDNRPATF